jgi:hypothetical protein
MLERSIRHAWKAKPSSDTKRFGSALRHTRSRTSASKTISRCASVNLDVLRGYEPDVSQSYHNRLFNLANRRRCRLRVRPSVENCAAPRRMQDLKRDLREVEPRDGSQALAGARSSQGTNREEVRRKNRRQQVQKNADTCVARSARAGSYGRLDAYDRVFTRMRQVER